MPKLSEEEIKKKIADGAIFAISIDTAVFDRYGCNLDFPVLKRLDQFKSSSTQVLFSEIIIKEVEGHIAKAAVETQRTLRKALKKQASRWKKDLDKITIPDELELGGDPKSTAKTQVANFVDAVGGKIVPANGSPEIVEELLRRYFAVEPPFESKEDKKHEFPDGFALLSLESVAKDKGKLILSISPDKGWNDFSEQSEHLVCVQDLNVALSYFNEAGHLLANKTMAMCRDGTATDLINEIQNTIQDRLDDCDFNPDGSSPFSFESEPIGAGLQRVDVESASPPVVINVDEDEITFTTNVETLISFEASFTFYVKDGVDKDYIRLGSEYFVVEQRVKLQLAITVESETSPQPRVVNVEVAKKHIEVDFGNIEPFEEDPNHERY